jgi:hypothetical protein
MANSCTHLDLDAVCDRLKVAHRLVLLSVVVFDMETQARPPL